MGRDHQWPSLTFLYLPWPSMTFYDLLWPFITFKDLYDILWLNLYCQDLVWTRHSSSGTSSTRKGLSSQSKWSQRSEACLQWVLASIWQKDEIPRIREWSWSDSAWWGLCSPCDSETGIQFMRSKNFYKVFSSLIIYLIFVMVRLSSQISTLIQTLMNRAGN